MASQYCANFKMTCDLKSVTSGIQLKNGSYFECHEILSSEG